MTWNKGGAFFDKQGNHQLGAGSIARETLKWWANTFEKGLDIADPELLKVQFTDLGQGVRRRQEPLSRAEPSLWPERRQRSGAVADRRQGQGPGLARRRQDDRRHPRLLPVDRDARQGMGLEAAAVSRRQDQGRQLHAGHQPRQDAMLGSGYTSVMNSDAVKQGWAPWGDVPEILQDLGQGDLHRRGRARRSISPGTSRGPTSSTSRSRRR